MTNKEIAEKLNITPSAVSMALHNKGGVSEAKKKVIMQMKFAQSPDSNETPEKGNILFSIHKKNGNVISETHFFITLISSIQEYAEKLGYYINVVHYDGKDDFSHFLSANNIEDVKGILVLATELSTTDADRYVAIGKPIVFIDRFFQERPYNCVLMDNEDGVVQSLRYAYKQGHRRIGIITSSSYLYNFNERVEGFRKGMALLHLPINRKDVYRIRCTTDDAYEDMCHIIRSTKDFPTLFFVVNDVMAIGVINAFKYEGYQVPKDISFIGFDNMPIARYFSPTLTSVNIKAARIGRVAFKRLCEIIEEKEDDFFVHNLVGTNLIVRNSVANLDFD